MTTNSYLEFYLTLLGWVINNGIWDALVGSGVFAIPLSAILIEEWLRSRAEGADEGNKGVLAVARIENRMYVAFLVMIFGCVPFFPISLSQIQLDKQASVKCGVSVATPQHTAWNKSFQSIGGQTAYVPIWWYLVHALSKGLSAAATATIPCSPDIRQMAMEIDEAQIPDRMLLQEISDFTNDCYGAARYQLFREKPTLSAEEDYDTGWIGSAMFLNNAGEFYDKIQARTPLRKWPYQEPRDTGYGRAPDGGGYPTCKQWWSDSGIGLRDRILGSVNPGLMDQFKNWWNTKPHQAVEETIIRELVSPQHQAKAMAPGDIYQEYGYSSRQMHGTDSFSGTLTNLGTSLGMALNTGKLFTSMNALKTALPMIQAFLLMAIVICLPFIMVISTYSLKAVMTATFGIFTLHMLTFWWELARWIDSSMLDALYGEVTGDWTLYIPLIGSSMDGHITSNVMNFVMPMLFVVLPMVFFSAMSWAGMKVGLGMEQMMTGGTKQALEAGGRGGDAATKKATGI